MRVKINDKFDAQIESLADVLGIPNNEVINLVLSRFLPTFSEWVGQPTPPFVPSEKPAQPTTATPELIDADLPPMEF